MHSQAHVQLHANTNASTRTRKLVRASTLALQLYTVVQCVVRLHLQATKIEFLWFVVYIDTVYTR